MSNKEDDLIDNNHVDRSSRVLMILKPWQLFHLVIDEGLGLMLLEAKEVLQESRAFTAHEQNDFDSNGKGFEVAVLFVSREDYRTESFAAWCSKTPTPDTAWMVIIERRDGKSVSGRIHAFEPHERGIVARIRLTIYDREHPPAKDSQERDITKIVVRYGTNRITRKTAHAKARE